MVFKTVAITVAITVNFKASKVYVSVIAAKYALHPFLRASEIITINGNINIKTKNNTLIPIKSHFVILLFMLITPL